MTVRDWHEALAALRKDAKFEPDAETLEMVKESVKKMYGVEWPDLPWAQAVDAVLKQRIEYWNDCLRRRG